MQGAEAPAPEAYLSIRRKAMGLNAAGDILMVDQGEEKLVDTGFQEKLL